MKLTNLKVIASGSTIESYEYCDKALSYDFENKTQRSCRPKIVVSDEESKKRKLESRRRSMLRSRSNLRRLVNANARLWFKENGKPYLPVFVTLTFAEDVKDIKTANLLFSHFVKDLNYYITGDSQSFLKYVGVIEFQDLNRGGVVHYHIVFFNLRKIMKNTVYEIWGNGNIDIKKVHQVDNIGAYISKYMSKNFEDTRLDGQKRYFPSKGLRRPKCILDQVTAQSIVNALPKKALKKQKEFESPVHGRVIYTQYRLDKQKTLSDLNINENHDQH